MYAIRSYYGIVAVNIIQQSVDFDQRLGAAAFMLLKGRDEVLARHFDEPLGEFQGSYNFV